MISCLHRCIIAFLFSFFTATSLQSHSVDRLFQLVERSPHFRQLTDQQNASQPEEERPSIGEIRKLLGDVIDPLVLDLYKQSRSTSLKASIVARFGSSPRWGAGNLLQAAFRSNDPILQLAAVQSGLFCPDPAWRKELLSYSQSPSPHPLVQFSIALNHYYHDRDKALSMLDELSIFTDEMQFVAHQVTQLYRPPDLSEIEMLLVSSKSVGSEKVATIVAAAWLSHHNFASVSVQKLATSLLEKAQKRQVLYPALCLLAPSLITTQLSQENLQSIIDLIPLIKKDPVARYFAYLFELYGLLEKRQPPLEAQWQEWKEHCEMQLPGFKPLISLYLENVLYRQDEALVSHCLDQMLLLDPTSRNFLIQHTRICVETLSPLSKQHQQTLQEMMSQAQLDLIDHYGLYSKKSLQSVQASPFQERDFLAKVLQDTIASTLKQPLQERPLDLEKRIADLLLEMAPFQRLYCLTRIAEQRDDAWQKICTKIAEKLDLSELFLQNHPVQQEMSTSLEHDPQSARYYIWHHLLQEDLSADQLERSYPHLIPSDREVFFLFMKDKWNESHLHFILKEIISLRPRQDFPSNVKFLVELYDALIVIQKNGPAT